MRTKNHPGTVVQASWLATALAGLLAFATPVTASLAGERAAGPTHRAAITTNLTLDGTASDVLSNARRRPDPSAAVPATRVLAEHGEAPVARIAPVRRSHVLVRANPAMVARAHPWSGAKVIGEVPAVSRFYHEPLELWVEEMSRNGRWGRIEIPYAWPQREGWIELDGLRRHRTPITVRVDLSRRTVRVYRGDELLYRVIGAIGAPVSPTPTGDYVVTDRVPFSAGSSLGSFAFGISGIQPNLPPGWSGGDQLAIHGTNSPSSIGQSVSAGCIRVSQTALEAFLPLLRQGTPVLIRP